MTTAIDSIFAELVPDLLQEFGASVVITKRTGTVAPSTRSITGGSTTAQTLDCTPPEVMRSVSPGEPIRQIGDLSFLTKGTPTFAIEPDQMAPFGGKVYRVVDVVKMYSGDDIAAYDVAVRAST